ncbi:raffinose/stachyose/melibiose transport system substrate-binding protein [Aequitasia blattaphilus]|uniref:Extracellular solute-binding protein n=1 Tax=Aequitasia blattaphilus TaxID=2949332 RepID=A0ABT1EF17_9FIRM|nr:extracellular solute-binding protein [Aequitasia blattaphilus]MCP1103057.1 extracellular solute-binding protein [Aequitasia blattaphilus]MCR8615697.1 extracellular solute-binding protein [Aequitasia blattaphilus]
MKKRIVAVCMILSMTAAVIAGCSNKSGEADNGEKKDSKKGKTISIMASQDWVYDAEMELGKQFEEETGIKVDYQIVPADQYYNLLMTKLNSGEGPDIFGGQSGSFDLVSQYKIQDNAMDLSDQPWVEYYDEFAKEQTSVDGKVYGATFYDTTTDYYIVYNKKLFQENNLEVPKSFSEFESACQTLLDAGITPFYQPVGDGWHHVMWFCEIGGKYEELVPNIVDDLNNNKTTFAETNEFKKVLEQVNGLAQKGYFGDNYLSDEFSDMGTYLGSGEFAMSACKAGAIAEIVAASEGAYTEEDFGFFLYPVLDNDVLNEHPCGPSRFIYSGSENAEEAKQYLEYITKKDSIQSMIDNEPRVENLPYDAGQTPAYSEETEKFLESFDKRGVVFQDSIKYLNPQWMEIGQDMVSMFIEDMTPEQVLKGIDDRRATQAEAAGDEAW